MSKSSSTFEGEWSSKFTKGGYDAFIGHPVFASLFVSGQSVVVNYMTVKVAEK